MKNKLCFLFSLVLYINFLCAQSQWENVFKKQDSSEYKFDIKKIKLAEAKTTHPLKNITSINIIDSRPDTSDIGFMQKSEANRFFLRFDNSVRFQIENFSNNYFSIKKRNDSAAILMVIKKLWLSDELATIQKRLNDPALVNPDSSSGIVAKIEFYLKKNADYFPLYRFDTVIIKPFLVAKNQSEFLKLAILSSFDKLIDMDETGFALKKYKLTLSEIAEFNNNSFNLHYTK